MKILLLCIGKTDDQGYVDLINIYTKRINHYINFTIEFIPDTKIKKKSTPSAKMMEEAKQLQQKIKPGDHLILLDESGKEYSSTTFAKTMEKKMASGIRRLVFVVGGAYGFSEQFKSLYKEKLSLSRMTFSHQIVRLFFCEQLYRSFTILNNHPYHNN